eukprot:6573129-Alexandrium_andersonii.AAC.1
MSASLVGSEMCIRDRPPPARCARAYSAPEPERRAPRSWRSRRSAPPLAGGATATAPNGPRTAAADACESAHTSHRSGGRARH